MLYDIISNGFNFLIDLCTPSITPVPSTDSFSFESDAVLIYYPTNEQPNYDKVVLLEEQQYY